MGRIIIKREDLDEKLAQMEKEAGQLIEFYIIPAEADVSDEAPAFLHVGCIHSDGRYEDLESIDEHVA